MARGHSSTRGSGRKTPKILVFLYWISQVGTFLTLISLLYDLRSLLALRQRLEKIFEEIAHYIDAFFWLWHGTVQIYRGLVWPIVRLIPIRIPDSWIDPLIMIYLQVQLIIILVLAVLFEEYARRYSLSGMVDSRGTVIFNANKKLAIITDEARKARVALARSVKLIVQLRLRAKQAQWAVAITVSIVYADHVYYADSANEIILWLSLWVGSIYVILRCYDAAAAVAKLLDQLNLGRFLDHGFTRFQSTIETVSSRMEATGLPIRSLIGNLLMITCAVILFAIAWMIFQDQALIKTWVG